MASTELRAARWENQGEPFPFFRQLNDFASYPELLAEHVRLRMILSQRRYSIAFPSPKLRLFPIR